MTRKDYVAVAEILADFKQGIDNQAVFEDLVDEFADFFAGDNPNFKYDKFREACNEQNHNNSSATSYCRRCVCLLAFDVARFKRRYS